MCGYALYYVRFRRGVAQGSLKGPPLKNLKDLSRGTEPIVAAEIYFASPLRPILNVGD